jgi:hypothetical protein
MYCSFDNSIARENDVSNISHIAQACYNEPRDTYRNNYMIETNQYQHDLSLLQHTFSKSRFLKAHMEDIIETQEFHEIDNE